MHYFKPGQFLFAVATAFSSWAMADDVYASQGTTPDLGQALVSTPGATHLALTQPIGHGINVRLGASSTGLNQLQPSSLRNDAELADTFLPTASSTMIELSKSFGAAALSVALSQINESNPYLGTLPSGTSLFGPRTTTSVLHIGGSVRLAPKWVLAGHAAYGIAPAVSANGNSPAELSAARANAFAVGVIAADRVAPGDRVSLALSQPPRSYSGTTLLDALTGTSHSLIDSDDRLTFSLVPLGRAMRVELKYYRPTGRNASAGVSMMVRRNPNDLEGAPATDKILALRYTKQY